MNEQTFDTLTRETARGLSRRASLATLGATSVAALAAPLAADAKKKKKCKKKDKKCPSLEEICAPQVEDCIEIVSIVCGDEPGCDHIVGCCETFDTCDVSAFLVCLNAQPPS